MPISHEKRVIFIHIPKNAGESIERTLGIYGGNPNETLCGILHNTFVLQHFTAPQLRKFLADDDMWNQYFKFAIVRNPWSKAVSEYHWYLRYGPNCTFKAWVKTLSTRIRINQFIHLCEVGHNLKQCDFIFDQSGTCMVDKVLKFENLQDEFFDLASHQGWQVELIHAHTTASKDKKDFRTYYDAETIALIEAIYKDDINAFGYDKNSTFA